MTQRNRNKRKALRAQRREEKIGTAVLKLSDGQIVEIIDDNPQLLGPDISKKILEQMQLTPEALKTISDIAANPQSTADILNSQVPSFSDYVQRHGLRIADEMAQQGKPGAFLFMQILKQMQPPEEKEQGND